MATTMELTVKTLDSQNHQFKVDENMTVKDFKEEISPRIGIPADQQRLIFRGRVLQDEKKMSECNVANNTIHVVQRPANASNNRNNDVPSPTNNDRSGLDGGNGGNAIIMGAIGLPSIDIQSEQGAHNTVSRRNSAAIRLQVGNQMLGRASALLRRLEEDDSVSTATAAVDSSTLPETGRQNEAHEQGQDNNGGGDASQMEMEMEIDSDDQNSFGRMISQVAGAASAAALVAAFRQVPSNTNNAGNTGSANNTGSIGTGSGLPADSVNTPPANEGGPVNNQRPEAPRLREMAVVLQDILAVQERFLPFLQYVESTLQSNRLYENTDDRQSTQYVFDTVSSIMHYLSHTYHALSDIMCDFSTAPETRRLRAAASILVEQSTVVRATIPIAVPTQMLSGSNILQSNATGTPTNDARTPNVGGNTASSGQPHANPVTPAFMMSAGSPGQQPQFSFGGSGQIPINIGGMGQGGFDLSAILGPAMAGGMMPLFMNQNQAQQRPATPSASSPSNSSPYVANQISSNGPNGQTTRPQAIGIGNTGTRMTAQQYRNEMSRPPFDILLSCHSHHGGRNQTLRNSRPGNLRQFVNVTQGRLDQITRSPSENFLLNCFDFIQQSNILNLLQPVLQDVIQNYLMRGRDAKNMSHIRSCAKSLAKKFTPFFESFTDKVSKRSDKVVYSETYCNLVSKFFTEVLQLIISTGSDPQFKTKLIRACEDFLCELVAVFKVCFSDGQGYIPIFVKAVVDKLLSGTSLIFRENATKNLTDYFSGLVLAENISVHSVIVYKENEVASTPSTSQSASAPVISTTISASRPLVAERSVMDEVQPPKQSKQNHPSPSPTRVVAGQSMDEDIDDLLNLTAPRRVQGQGSGQVDVNSFDASLRNLPTEWMENVRRDLRNQLGMPEQPPFSPGYVALLSRKP